MSSPSKPLLYLAVFTVHLTLLFPAFAQDATPSFDCRRATRLDERTICETPRLAELDQAIDIAMHQISGDMAKYARENAVSALKSRRDCGSNRLCILDTQAMLLANLNGSGARVNMPPWVGSFRMSLITQMGALLGTALPTQVGACSQSKISGIATRFGEELHRPTGDEFDSGSSVNFANGGYQVSYAFEEAIADSRIGDETVICLVSIPKNCPKGDDRGRFYSATNLRTKGSWILPDAQHMCGGA